MSKEIVLWSRATVFLSTLSLEPTGGLTVSFSNSVPQDTLVSIDEVRYEDIKKVDSFHRYISNPNVQYVGGEPSAWTTVKRSWNLNSTGSGSLKVKANFDWEFAALPWARPDASAEGPENVLINILINDKIVAHYQSCPGVASLPINLENRLLDGPTAQFSSGEIRNLTIIIETNANGGWLNKPEVPPTPPKINTITLL